MPTIHPENYCDYCGQEWVGDYSARDYYAHFETCAACGCYYCPEEEGCRCGCDAEPTDTSSGGEIYYYSYKPSPQFFGGNGPYHIGVELEINTDRYDAGDIYRWASDCGMAGLFYCKEDSSVDGFEIVTHPMTPDFADRVPWDSFFTMLNEKYPADCDGEEPEEHGIHIHVSRRAFPRASTLARWNYLWNRNSEEICRVARRHSEEWAAFTDIPVSLLLPMKTRPFVDATRYEHYDVITGYDYTEQDYREYRQWLRQEERRLLSEQRFSGQWNLTGYFPERYQAVNLTNASTVEVRVFKSTREAGDFLSAIHLVTSTVDYVRSVQPWHATTSAVLWDAYAAWVLGSDAHRPFAPALLGEDYDGQSPLFN